MITTTSNTQEEYAAIGAMGKARPWIAKSVHHLRDHIGRNLDSHRLFSWVQEDEPDKDVVLIVMVLMLYFSALRIS